MTRVTITEEMKRISLVEAKKRDDYIKHHFEVNHLSSTERDQIGFLGEFACCSLFDIDWKGNIRENYLTIDSYDLIINNKKIDVKTETVPEKYAKKIINGNIHDNELYGRRLINKDQFSLLFKYDLVIFGLFIRNKLDYWYPIGFLETKIIINNHPPTFKRPDGGNYPFSGSPVPTSTLKPITDLL